MRLRILPTCRNRARVDACSCRLEELTRLQCIQARVMTRGVHAILILASAFACGRPEESHRIVCGGEAEGADRITLRVVEADPASPAKWAIKISGRAFPADDTGFARLGSVLKQLADKDRRTNPPHVSERPMIVRADPEAPTAVVISFLELCARAGIYRIEVAVVEPLPAAPGDDTTRPR